MKASPPFLLAVERLGYHQAARDWFEEQAKIPELMQKRGLRPREPLPRGLGLFDPQGLPCKRQTQANWRRLLAWLNDDEAVLAFFFPEGLNAQDKKVLRSDLAILKRQPWSPQAFVQATLDAWPAGEDLDFSLKTAEQRMIEACHAFLHEP